MGIRHYRMMRCRCGLFRSYYKRWNDPSLVGAQLSAYSKLDNLEMYYHYFKNFNYDPENPDAPCSFKRSC